MVCFDLPTETKADKRAYREFRKFLLEDGFFGLQYSVYARPTTSPDSYATHRNRVLQHLPDHGQVRLLGFTDRQFGRMEVYSGITKQLTERLPEQLEIF